MSRRRLPLLVLAAVLPGLFLGTAVAMGRLPLGSSDKSYLIYVAHAGGGYEGAVHTSSEEAMEKSYAEGYRLFELDVEFTSDGRVVLVHDWRTFFRFSNLNHWPTFDEYTHAEMKLHFRPPTLERLEAFLKAHPDTFVIIDSKRAHVAFLQYIARNFPAIVPQTMPYIYAERDYDVVRGLGYRNIIFGDYISRMNDDQIISLVERHSFFAVAVPASRPYSFRARQCGDKWCLPAELKARGVKLFVHVVNTRAEAESARKAGVSGILSDWLIPARGDVRRTAEDLPTWRRHPV